MVKLEGMERCSSQLSSAQFISVTQSCPTLCYPMNRSTPRLPVHHQHLEFTQTHTHRVCDAIQPSHPLSSPSPPVPNPSQHQGLFQWVNCSHEGGQVVLEFQLQRQSFQWKLTSFRIDFWIPLQSKVLSRVFSNTIFQKYPFCAAQLSSQSYHHIHTWPLGKAIALTRWPFLGKVISLLLNMLLRLVRTFLPRNKPPLISWIRSPSAVMLEPTKTRDDRKAQSSEWTRKKYKLQRSQLESLNHSCDEKFLKSQKPRSR